MGMTNAERQARFRAKKAEAGLRQITAMVHSRQMADVLELLRQLAENPDLEVGLVRNVKTGRYQKLT